MKKSFRLKISGLFGLLLLFLPACKKPVNPCIKSLMERNQNLIQRTDSLILIKNEIPLRIYRARLQQMRSEEEQIFSEVRDCDFGDDLRSYNYWYRGRLKFPGKIEQELQRLEQDSVGK